MSARAGAEVNVGGRRIVVSHPDKVFFAARQETKLDLVRYYLSVGAPGVRGVLDRPCVLKRYPEGAGGSFFFQKRVPAARPDWLSTVVVRFPSGREAEELCPRDLAHVVWAVNLGALGLDPWPVRRDELDRPDELRVDLDPQPGVAFSAVREVAWHVRALLEEDGLVAHLKTSGSRGLHVYVRTQRLWGFGDVRRAALAIAREVERRAPGLATSAWWKRDRGRKVFLDYNQNARDRTIAAAYSVRANAEGRVSCPLHWEELDSAEPADLTIATVPARLAREGDPWATMDARACSLAPLLERAERDAAAGLPDAPLPPRFSKGSDGG